MKQNKNDPLTISVNNREIAIKIFIGKIFIVPFDGALLLFAGTSWRLSGFRQIRDFDFSLSTATLTDSLKLLQSAD